MPKQIVSKRHQGGPPRQIHNQAVSRAELTKRQIRVSELLLEGNTYREIARQVGVKSTKTIHDDVQKVLGIWREEHQHNVDDWIALELGKIGHVESEAWEGWERSKKAAQTVAVKTAKLIMRGGRGKDRYELPGEQVEKTETTKDQVGEARFLELALKCTERRCILLGLNAPEKIAPTDPTGTKEWVGDLTDEERTARIASLLDIARTRRTG